jgi:uncharacterized protein
MPLDPQRPLGLRFKGDWGAFNLTRICGWLAYEVWRCAGEHTNSVIYTGRGMGDNLVALARGEVDVSIATPAQFARMAREGKGRFASEPLTTLRAVGCLPHNDALLIAIPSALNIRTMAELRDAKPKMRIAVAPDDGENFMGLGAAAVLRASGIDPDDILAWGGAFVFGEDPSECIEHVSSGAADAVIQEAIMTRWWSDLASSRDLTFLSLEDDAVQRLERDLALSTVDVPAGHLRGMDEPVTAVDFSGWLVLVREDMRDDVAGLLAGILAEESSSFEAQYQHLPVRFSPLAYPITLETLVATCIPLHAGAERYYTSVGALAS